MRATITMKCAKWCGNLAIPLTSAVGAKNEKLAKRDDVRDGGGSKELIAGSTTIDVCW